VVVVVVVVVAALDAVVVSTNVVATADVLGAAFDDVGVLDGSSLLHAVATTAISAAPVQMSATRRARPSLMAPDGNAAATARGGMRQRESTVQQEMPGAP
jgi:hypothetical protein